MVTLFGIAAALLVSQFGPAGAPRLLPDSDYVAFVCDIRGTVKMKHLGGTKILLLKKTQFLKAGDQVWAEAGGRAWVYEQYSRAELIKTGKRKTIANNPAKTGPMIIDRADFARLAAIAATASSEANRPNQSYGSLLTARAPRSGYVLDTHPLFYWSPLKKGTVYEVTLTNEQGEVRWQTTTEQTYAVMSAQEKPLLPGTYGWRVTAKQAGESFADSASFDVPYPEQRKEMNKALADEESMTEDKSGSNLLYVAACMSHRLYQKAELELLRSLQRSPDDQTLWEILMLLYQTVSRNADRKIIFDAKDKGDRTLKELYGEQLPQVGSGRQTP